MSIEFLNTLKNLLMNNELFRNLTRLDYSLLVSTKLEKQKPNFYENILSIRAD